jgi:hypothetical protein
MSQTIKAKDLFNFNFKPIFIGAAVVVCGLITIIFLNKN